MRYKTLLSVSVLAAVAVISFAAGAAATKKSTMTAMGDYAWEDLMPGAPLKIAKVWGDRTKGEYTMLLKMPAGFQAGMHAHSADYHGITIQGTWVHTDDGGESKELPVGSYVMQPGKMFHDDSCKGTQDCIILIHQHKKGDFIPKPAPKEEKK